MCDIGFHISLPTLSIIVLGLLEKKEEKRSDEQFVWVAKLHLRYLVLHMHILAVLKVSTNANLTMKNAYAVKPA